MGNVKTLLETVCFLYWKWTKYLSSWKDTFVLWFKPGVSKAVLSVLWTNNKNILWGKVFCSHLSLRNAGLNKIKQFYLLKSFLEPLICIVNIQGGTYDCEIPLI